MKLFFAIRHSLIGLLVSVGTVIYGQSAIAADAIMFQYGLFSETFSVQELTEFSRTGQQSPIINYYLRRTNQNPETVRTALNREVPVRLVTLDRLLNSPVGEAALDRIGRTIQTPANAANRQALRAALVLSSSDDNKISLIEVFQKYPTSQLNVDGQELISTYNRVSELAQRIQNISDIFRAD